MKNNKIEFFTWVRKIEFIKLKKHYEHYYSNIININNNEFLLLKKYLNQNLFTDYTEKDFDKIKEKFKKEENFDPIENINKDINKKEDAFKQKIYDILIDIEDHLKQFSKHNYNKLRKHKIIYFIIGHAINTNKKYSLWKEESDIFSSFISNKKNYEKMTWCAFENGPILNSIYNPSPNEDNDLFIIYKNEKQLIVFEMAYFFLKNFSTIELIEESHETKPWKDNFEKYSYYKKIKNSEIIEYFKNNEPFFIKLINENN
ncbi:hypothetical protein [Candidatus Hepatoplasma crinochetorum]|jgi:hypothetical protein|uniref:hypothetical protein n=1 Tax=Candidatus Hepatoplasma crinochetorum TaxID=295596 RepID=UPI00308F2E68|nr:MAG: hypothetical protein HCTKY_2710 [Candidatus Hepatoplasma crinochetorum]